MAAAMNGLDALVFTGGVGENAGAIRAATVAGLEFLGLAIDAGRNEVASGDREIGPEGKVPAVLVVVSREDLEIARQVRALLAG
jgi:acetate kinase